MLKMHVMLLLAVLHMSASTAVGCTEGVCTMCTLQQLMHVVHTPSVMVLTVTYTAAMHLHHVHFRS